jgi:hypothetical protein
MGTDHHDQDNHAAIKPTRWAGLAKIASHRQTAGSLRKVPAWTHLIPRADRPR